MAPLDSRIALALMAKADLVFGGRHKLVCFPIGGASFTEADLDFYPDEVSAESQRRALIALADFSALTNTVPSGRVWESGNASGANLARVYRRVLESANIAALHESPEDTARLQAARAVMTRTLDDGTPADTAQFAAFKHCRDVFYLAEQSYNAARVSGEVGASDEDRATWAQQEPMLRAARDHAEIDWRVSGHRAEIEEAVAVISTLTRRTPLTAWSEWDARSRRGPATQTDPSGQAFWPTYLSPANAPSVGWQSMSLTGGEIAQLQNDAPAELRQRLGSGTSPQEIKKLEFQFSSAGLQRPWFDPMVFSSRFWKPRAESPIAVSNGAAPFAGECPLYASGVVFFRNIRATVDAELPAWHRNLTHVTKLDYGLFRLNPQKMRVIAPPAVAGSAVAPATDRAAATLPTRAPAAVIGRAHLARIASERRVVGIHRFSAARLIERSDRAATVPPFMVAPPPPARRETVIETAPDEIFVLAFICSVVPPSPDPDPALSWSQ